MSTVINKMLDALGLRIKTERFRLAIDGVNERKNGFVRSFVDRPGRILVWWNDNPASLSGNGNGIPGGSWSVFKNDDIATFSLFTEKIKKFSFDFSRDKDAEIANPFYGCKSIEEVFVKCDLLQC